MQGMCLLRLKGDEADDNYVLKFTCTNIITAVFQSVPGRVNGSSPSVSLFG